ncbi:pentatricopeptide repeat-containing protein At4g26680, mitochondrial [Daucus carota subsp. sativus]|nr:PREDICTED: pentatricopeptide repeat-containing protein At4g26680, mitochondrial [Daucus carota subsp. sativus]
MIMHFRRLSTLINPTPRNPFAPSTQKIMKKNKWDPIPLPHRTMPEPKGQDLDFVNVAYSHLVHADWAQLEKLASGLSLFRVKHILLRLRNDHVLSYRFFRWFGGKNPSFRNVETLSMILHILSKHRKFRSAEGVLKEIVDSGSVSFHFELFDALVDSYRVCDSSPRVFDSVFKTYAHLKKIRNATDMFCWMRNYGFLPTVESCNALLSSSLNLNRGDIALKFYKEMQRSRISANVYTFNMVVAANCKLGKLEKAVTIFKEMESLGFNPTVASYNTLIAGYCKQDLLSSAMKLKDSMVRNGVQPTDITYNTLIHGLCKEGKLLEANKIFNEMKGSDVTPTTVTYNTLINGYGQIGNNDMAERLFEEMSRDEIKADILTYNALILGLCKEGMTKKAAYLVKELDRKHLVPNSSTFSALIRGQCARKDSGRAYQLYKSMIRSGCHPNEYTLNMLLSALCESEDYNGGVQVLTEMLNRGIAPNSTTLTDLYKGLRLCGKDELVLKLSKEINDRHIVVKDSERDENNISQPNF